MKALSRDGFRQLKNYGKAVERQQFVLPVFEPLNPLRPLAL